MKAILLLNLCVCSAWGVLGADPLVRTKKGLIRGLRATDGDYSMFLGIPYAKVNDSNPFGLSLPYPDFDDVYDANDDSAMCPQIEEFNNTIAGTLDCLHLNIYVPDVAPARGKLPVLVWVYGGGFNFGFAGRFVYGPKYLVRNDIIVITLNYRLGPYGFMCLGTPEVPGNQGLKDQLRALRWINEHIEAFGGDPEKVTLFGESAGGAAVDHHLLSDQERLFDKVIIQSGSAQSPWSVNEPNTVAPIAIARWLGRDFTDVNDALNFLATVEPRLVIIASLASANFFVPCVEKDIEGVERFIARHPVNSAIPKAKDVLILKGYNNQEMLVPYVNKPASDLSLDLFKQHLSESFDLSKDASLETLVRQFYVGDEEGGEGVRWDLMDFEADITYNHPIHRSLQKYLQNEGTVYHNIFSYSGGRNFVKYRNNITEGGASHADEIGYLFDVALFKESPSEQDQLVIDRITTMWANFVKYGDPTPEVSDLLPVKWPPITGDIYTYLDIDKELTIASRPFHRRAAFLDLVYKSYKHLLKGYEGNEKK